VGKEEYADERFLIIDFHAGSVSKEMGISMLKHQESDFDEYNMS